MKTGSKCRRIALATIMAITAILLTGDGTATDALVLASASCARATSSAARTRVRVETSRIDLQASEAAGAISAAAEAATDADWPMVAANPQRTSWTPEEVRGKLRPVWYRSFEPFINNKVQVIAAHDTLYMSTARGLYALSTVDLDGDGVGGDLKWVFPTELPLGHSPTVINHPSLGWVVYVGGYDKKIHALRADPDLNALLRDAETGYRLNNQVLWTFEAGNPSQDRPPADDPGFLGAGFETNPLLIDPTTDLGEPQDADQLTLYAGNRNGYLYALDATTGALRWKFRTQGPILFSAAYKEHVLYFASNDSHAYALDAQTGEPVWNVPGTAEYDPSRPAGSSQKLPGEGFFSFWPVVYQSYVIFAGSEGHSDDIHGPGVGAGFLANQLDRADLYAGIPDGELIGPIGNEPGDWAEGTVTIDDSRATGYYENKPWRRRNFVLNRLTGEEFTFDSDNDGQPEYAPNTYCWTHSGTRYPPVIGGDGVLYQHNSYISDPYIPLGGISGWKFGTEFISRVHEGQYGAVDEPLVYSAGGSLIYWSLCCDRSAGAYDITMPYGAPGRYWVYFAYNLGSQCPGLESDSSVFGGQSGVYGSHGTVNPPIPYKGQVYIQKSNAIIAWAPSAGSPAQLPRLQTVRVQDRQTAVSTDQLREKLAVEIQKMLAAGHLRPGYHSSGISDQRLNGALRNFLTHYFHNPGETLYTFARALPHLPGELQQQAREYLQQEFANYGQYVHIGWADGALREAFDTPPEVQARMDSFAPQISIYGMKPWDDQYRFYGLWKYAQGFGGAREIFDSNKARLRVPADDGEVNTYPYAHNAYIAGYWGYLELEQLAGYPETPEVRAELDRLLVLRATNFTQVLSYGWHEPLNIAANFMYLTPELAQYLHDHAYYEVKAALKDYNDMAPGWFVSKYDATSGEGTLQILQDYQALFQARALILKQCREELVKYLDVPAFDVGDLYYIQNLVAAIEAPQCLYKTATPISGSLGTAITYTLSFGGYGSPLTLTDTLPVGLGAPGSFELEGTSVVPTYGPDDHRITWSASPTTGQEVIIRYAGTITVNGYRALVNTAELRGTGGELSTATATVIANPYLAYLPLILKRD